MLSLSSVVRIYLHSEPVNLHFGFDRLANLVSEELGQDPLSGHLFVFRNRRCHWALQRRPLVGASKDTSRRIAVGFVRSGTLWG